MSNSTDTGIPSEINKADTAFMLICASLVMLMTPGLAFFYGGLVSRKSVLAIMIQSFVSLAVTDVIWFCYGYSLAFGEDQGGIIGNLDKAFLMNIKPWAPSTLNPGVPEIVVFVYQMMFAIITPALITGAFINRVKFKAYLIFLVFWLTLVYIPWVHWIWGGGFFAKWGVVDFAGGIVVHATAGMGALASVFAMGSRKAVVNEPHNLPLVSVGTGLLWFGWYGFNAGSEFAVDGTTVLAFFNTDIAASFAAVTWMIIEWSVSKKPKFLGLLTGSIAGLATITPCAGFVDTWAAVVIGIIAGAICYLAVWFKNRMKWDDSLDVWGVHGVGGITGTILLGCFATTKVNPLGRDGLFYGGGAFFGKQVAAVVFAGAWGFFFTYAMLWLLNRFLPGGARVEDEDEVDNIEFGETAYAKNTTFKVAPMPDGEI